MKSLIALTAEQSVLLEEQPKAESSEEIRRILSAKT
jgi:hypothetical protein